MLSPSQLQRLKHQHESIEEIIASLDRNKIAWQALAGKWSVHDNIAHLAKYQPVFIDRINTMLLEDHPAFDRYKAEEDPEFGNWRMLETAELLKRLKSDRASLFVLITKLDESQLNRKGHHPRFGSLSIKAWIEFFLLHEAHHLFTIFQLAHNQEIK